eukprot:GHVR01094701.1.p1 GENE.GHVR01094701.1~~GHVR01094701.1.p1  ORF type:complete len:143 (+),score=15.08 GHVR01094701.1:40-468(+)
MQNSVSCHSLGSRYRSQHEDEEPFYWSYLKDKTDPNQPHRPQSATNFPPFYLPPLVRPTSACTDALLQRRSACTDALLQHRQRDDERVNREYVGERLTRTWKCEGGKSSNLPDMVHSYCHKRCIGPYRPKKVLPRSKMVIIY